MATPELRAGIVGAGRLGTLHAQKYAKVPGVKLAFIVDRDRDRACALATANGAIALTDHRELVGRIDLATVAAPRMMHHPVARDLLEARVDVLIEKPMAAAMAEAHGLPAMATPA